MDGSQVIAHDGYDVQAFTETVTTFPKLARAVNEAQQQIYAGTALLRDLYWSFHKAAPRLAPASTPASEINRQIIAEIMSTSEWRELREIGTVGDVFASALATTGAGEKAIATLGAETIERMNELAELTSEAEKLFQEAEALQELSQLAQLPEKTGQLQAQAETVRAQAEQKIKSAAQRKEALDATKEEREQAVRRAARRGLRDARQEIEQVNDAAEAFGSRAGFGGLPAMGNNHRNETREKLNLAQQLQRNPKLNQIAAVCGRFKRIAWQQQKSRVKFPPEEIVSLTQGNDLARLLPGELALLASPDTEDLFFLRFAEQSLLQYDLIGHEPQGQGPIILALDESGSMNEHCGTMTKEVWSKSVMLGMLSIARWQKRDFAVIHFSGESEIRIDRFPKGLASTQEVIHCASHFYGGGTVFDEWMETALALVSESTFQQADCICLSDGVGDLHAHTRNRWRQIKQERGMRAYSILIGSDEGEATLKEFSDAVFCLDDLTEDLPALETIFSV